MIFVNSFFSEIGNTQSPDSHPLNIFIICCDFPELLAKICVQSWTLVLFFQVCFPLCAHFLTKDCYRSSAHFADFQVCSSLNRSKKQWFALGKEG